MVTRVASPIFVGRRDQLETVHDVLDRASSGRPTFVLVAGDAGVGKTRFVDEVGRRAEADGWRVLLGGCVPMGDDTLPYGPVIEALRRLAEVGGSADVPELLGPGSSELSRLVPGLVRSAAGASDGEVASAPSQGRLLEVLLAVLRHLAADRPLLFVVEDIHWADPSTLALLGYLARNLTGSIVVVATYRTDELHRRHPLLPFVAELERRAGVERIDLLPFDKPAVAELVRAIRVDAPAVLIDQLSERSDGNAFYIEELLATSTAIGALPATLREVLLARVATLNERTQDLLRVASAAGAQIGISLLGTVSGLSEAVVHDSVREAVERHILTLDRTTHEMTFRHALMREAIYESVLPWEQARLHAAFAGALEAEPTIEAHAGRIAALAYHWHAAHDLPRALVAAVRAGAAFDRVSATDEAHRQYERALDLWDRVPDAAGLVGLERVELLERAAAAASYSDPGAAAVLIRSALSLGELAADPARKAELWVRLGTYLDMSGDGTAGIDACRAAVGVLPSDAPPASRARVLAALGRNLMSVARFDEATPVLEEAVALAASVGADATEANALTSLGVNLGYLGDFESGRAKVAASREIAIRLASGDEVGRADVSLLDLLFHVGGRLAETAQVADASFTFLQESYLASHYGVIVLSLGAAALTRMGRWDEADALLDRARGYVSSGSAEIVLNERLALLEVGRGQHDVAADRIVQVRRLIGRSADPQYTLTLAAADAELALWQRRPQDAQDVIGQAFGRIGAPDVGAISLVGGFEAGNVSRISPVLALGMRAAADQVMTVGGRADHSAAQTTQRYLDAMRAIERENRRRRSSLVHLAAAYLGLGEGEHSRILGAPSAERWSDAALAFAALEMPYEQAYARWRQAEAHLAARGSRDRARPPLVEAHRLATQLGAGPLRVEIEGVARRARVDLDRQRQAADRPPKRDAAFGLTTRELEVLELLVAGLTNREIGSRLFISENTAGVHVSNILGKLGASRRVEAATIAHRLGLTEAQWPSAPRTTRSGGDHK